MAKHRTTKTATGSSLIDLAIRLMKQDSTLSFEDAKYTAKEQVKAKQNLEKKQQGLRTELEYGIGGKTKKKVLGALFGDRIGGYVSNKIRSKTHEEDVARRLIGGSDKLNERMLENSHESTRPPEPVPPREPIASSEIKSIEKKLTSIEASVKAIKAIKVQAPTKPTKVEPILKTQHHEDAELGLKALGYKKSEIQEMLKNAVGTTAQDLIKSALKPKNKDKIPVAAVPMAAARVRTEVHAMPVHEEPDAAQVEAKDTKASEEHHDEIKNDARWKKSVSEKLDEILKHVKHGGLLDDLMKIFGGVLAFIKPIWDIVKGIGAILENIFSKIMGAVNTIVKAIGNFIKKIPGLAKAAVEFLTEAVESGAAELGLAIGEVAVVEGSVAYMATRMGKDIKNKTDKNAKNYGLEIERDKKGIVTGNYKFNGVTVNQKDLTDEEKTVIDASQDYNPVIAKQAQAKIAKDPDKYKNLGVSDNGHEVMDDLVVSADKNGSKRVDDVSSENSTMKSDQAAPTVIQNIDNSKTTNAPQTNDSGSSVTVVNTKNMESSVSNYVNSIFSHPVMRLPI